MFEIILKKGAVKFLLQYMTVLLLLYFINIFANRLQKPILALTKQQSATNFQSSFLKIFNFGQKRLISSFIWVNTLIESDLEHYNNKDLNSWMFHRFKSIIEIDPEFYKAYLYGGQYLSVIKDDAVGAEYLYKKGIEKFPEDFWLRFYAGFHYLNEIGDLDAAYEQYYKIKDHPITKQQFPYLPGLISRIKAEQNQLETAYELIEMAYHEASEGTPLKARYKESLYSIRSMIDLNCLNSKKDNCRRDDYYGNKYILDANGEFKAAIKWAPFKLYKK